MYGELESLGSRRALLELAGELEGEADQSRDPAKVGMLVEAVRGLAGN